MRDMAMGQYYPSDSIIHRADPRFKIVILVLFLVTVFFCESFLSFGFLTFFVLATVFAARVPLLKVLKSLKAVIIILVITAALMMIFYADNGKPLAEWGIFHIYANGIYAAIKLGWRLMLLVIMPTVLTLTSTPTELCDGLESLLKPLKLIRLPVHEFALVMSIALRLIPTLIEETDKIVNAQKARCAPFESRNPFKKIKAMIPVLVPLFVSSFRRADELADAMDSRCYRGAKGRTRMKTLRFGVGDVLGLLFWCAVTVCVLFLKYNWLKFGFIAATAL